METYESVQQWHEQEPWGVHDLRWCRRARMTRAQQVRYFGTLAPEATNSAASVGGLYR